MTRWVKVLYFIKISNEIYFLHSQSTFDYNYNEVSSLCSVQVQNWKKEKKEQIRMSKKDSIKRPFSWIHFHQCHIFMTYIISIVLAIIHVWIRDVHDFFYSGTQIGFRAYKRVKRNFQFIGQLGWKKMERAYSCDFWVSWVKESIPLGLLKLTRDNFFKF